MTSATHDYLVRKALAWVVSSGRRKSRCSVALAEPWSMGNEHPDVIGWSFRGWSILVECKVSRSDFHADKRKRKRWQEKGYSGMGQERWYLAPRGLLTEHDAWGEWGLLELRKTKVYILAPAGRQQVVGTSWGGRFVDLDPSVRIAEWDVIYPSMLNGRFGDKGSSGDPRRFFE